MSPQTQASVSEDDARRSDDVRVIRSLDEAAEAIIAGYPIVVYSQRGWETSPLRRAEELAQGTLDLAHRMCYDYNHEIKNWEIDE